MQIKDLQESRDLNSLVTSMHQPSPRGLTTMRLVQRSGLDLNRIYELLARHRDYFVRVGSTSRYALNRFAKCKGALTCIQEAIRAEWAISEKRRKLSRLGFALIIASFVISQLS
jgi:hypothetical protein